MLQLFGISCFELTSSQCERIPELKSCKRCEELKHECDPGKPSQRAQRSAERNSLRATSSSNQTSACSSPGQHEFTSCAQCSKSSSQRSISELDENEHYARPLFHSTLTDTKTQHLQDLRLFSGVFSNEHEFQAAVELPNIQGSYEVRGTDDLLDSSRDGATVRTAWITDDNAQSLLSCGLLNMQPWRQFIPNAFERQLDHRIDRLWGNHKSFSKAGSGWYRVTPLFGRTFSELFRMSKQLAENVGNRLAYYPQTCS